MASEWEKVKKIGKHLYTHQPSYFTTVKREAERKAKMWEKMSFEVKIVKKLMKNESGSARFVYSLYLRNKTPLSRG
jgi:hypothetical protein